MHVPEQAVAAQVDLPKDPALEDFKHMKPAFGASPPSSESGSPKHSGAACSQWAVLHEGLLLCQL